jgi:hypothetical protein
MSDHSVRRILLFLLGLLVLGLAVYWAFLHYRHLSCLALIWAFLLFADSVESEGPE